MNILRYFFTRCTFISLLSLLQLTSPCAQQLAFPGAEGFGRYTTGGRGGEVYHVTNLNDSGAGSLRDAVSSPNRYVVFDVGGVINIQSRLVISRNITIAGQTAPGGGITVYGNGIALNDNSGNNIIQYIRFRMGENGDSRKDAVGISAGQDYVFDHVSMSWGWDGTLDVNGSGIDNLTFQDCIVGQGIDIVGHSTGGLMQSGKWSMIRSLYIDNVTRNPKARGTHEFINCVLYNWDEHGYIMGDTEGLSECNLIGNYFIYGPSSDNDSHITGTTPSFRVYAEDNWVDDNKNGQLDGQLLTNYKTATVINTPFNHPGVSTVMSAEIAVQYIIDHVGGSFPARDAVDEFLIDELSSFGIKGKIIDREGDNGIAGGVGTVENGIPLTDTDGDAMPDYFEDLIGYDKNKVDHLEDADGDGFPNLEEYFSCLTCNCDVPMSNCSGFRTGSYEMTLAEKGLCMQNAGASIKQDTCSNVSQFGWNVIEVEPEAFLIQSIHDESYLTFTSAQEGSVIIPTEFREVAKKFAISATDKSGYYIQLPDKELGLSMASSETGSEIILSSSPDEFLLSNFTPVLDCAGVIDGDAQIDACGQCTGGTTGIDPCPGGINGEDFCSGNGEFEADNPGYLGTGYFNFENTTGSKATYKIFSANSQSVQFAFRYANGGAGSRPLDISVNGISQVSSLAFPSTGGWSIWQEVSATLVLTEGSNEILLTATTADGGPNLDLIAFDAQELYNIDCELGYTLDCSGVPDGEAFIDDCEKCVGGTTGKEACSLEREVLNVETGKRIMVYPNPVSDFLIIQSEEMFQFSISDISGRFTYHSDWTQGHRSIELPSSGLYFVTVTDHQGKREVHKIVAR